VILDNAVTDRESQAGAFADRLGGKERIEDTRVRVGIDPIPAVLHEDLNGRRLDGGANRQLFNGHGRKRVSRIAEQQARCMDRL